MYDPGSTLPCGLPVHDSLRGWERRTDPRSRDTCSDTGADPGTGSYAGTI